MLLVVHMNDYNEKYFTKRNSYSIDQYSILALMGSLVSESTGKCGDSQGSD